jgi:hypothetical protein
LLKPEREDERSRSRSSSNSLIAAMTCMTIRPAALVRSTHRAPSSRPAQANFNGSARYSCTALLPHI